MAEHQLLVIQRAGDVEPLQFDEVEHERNPDHLIRHGAIETPVNTLR